MNEMGAMASPLLMLIVIIFLVVLAVLWFILPFAIFGTKRRLDQLIHEVRETNRLLRGVRPMDGDSLGAPAEDGKGMVTTPDGVRWRKEGERYYRV